MVPLFMDWQEDVHVSKHLYLTLIVSLLNILPSDCNLRKFYIKILPSFFGGIVLCRVVEYDFSFSFSSDSLMVSFLKVTIETNPKKFLDTRF